MSGSQEKRGDAAEVAQLATELERVRRRVAELEDQNSQLHRRDRQKDEFISNISHELRTSLASVRNVISNALAGVTGELNPKLKRSLQIADENIRRFGTIVSDLLDVTRLEAGRIVLHRTPQEPLRLIAAVIASFEEEAAKAGLTLRQETELPPVTVFFDGNRIAQVLGNLIGNAIKFTPWGGTITVRAMLMDAKHEPLSGLDLRSIPEGTALAIRVEDTGEGIEADRLERIFDRFEQAGNEEESAASGLGLGLFISRQFVLLHGGEIWAEAPHDGGSRFTFTLPLLRHEAIFRAAFADRLQTAALHQYSTALLLIDLAPSEAVDEPSLSISLEPEMPPLFETIRVVLRRKSDTVLWRGGARFAIFLPQTEGRDADAVARRILEALADEGIPTSGTGAPRIGIAAYPEDGASAEAIIAKAEERGS